MRGHWNPWRNEDVRISQWNDRLDPLYGVYQVLMAKTWIRLDWSANFDTASEAEYLKPCVRHWLLLLPWSCSERSFMEFKAVPAGTGGLSGYEYAASERQKSSVTS